MDILDYDLPLIFEKNRNLSVNQRIERDMPIIFNLLHFFEYDRHFDQHNEGGPVPEDFKSTIFYLKDRIIKSFEKTITVECEATPETEMIS